MTFDSRERVHLTGAREGAYLVAEERADGSLVLIPSGSSRGRPRHSQRVVGEDVGPLARLFRRRPQPIETADEGLEA